MDRSEKIRGVSVDGNTVVPGGRWSGEEKGQAELVLVPSGSALNRGFDVAKELLERGKPVRLVGDGVTIPAMWPAWVGGQDRLALTELGAYATSETVKRVADAADALEAWADRIFAGVVWGIAGGRVFYGPAVSRLYWDLLAAYPAVLGVVESHGPGRYHCSDPGWVGIEVLRALVRRAGGEVVRGGPARRSRRPAFVAVAVVLLALTLARHLILYVQSRESRRKLQRIRTGRAPAAVRLWLVLSPDWARINRHVVASLLHPLVDRGARPGVILFGGFRPGRRDERRLNRVVGDKVWPALGVPDSVLAECPVEQVVAPESVAELIAVSWRASVRSLAVVLRLARDRLTVVGDEFAIDLGSRVGAVARLATLDVYRAVAAESAARRMIERHEFDGTLVVFSASGVVPDTNVADLLLQGAGARTVHFFHGVVGGWYLFYPHVSSLGCFAQECDARAFLREGRPYLVSGVPELMAPEPGRPARWATNVLIVSSYVHRDSVSNGVLPTEPFQAELLGVVDAIRGAFGDRFRFRWRPHPADLDGPVNDAYGRLLDVELSRGSSFADDARWADVIITAFSTVAFEALPLGIPIFLHTLPGMRDFPAVLAFDRSRRFFRSAELLGPFQECVRALDAGDPDALRPEREAHGTLFTRSGELDELVSPYAELAPAPEPAGTPSRP